MHHIPHPLPSRSCNKVLGKLKAWLPYKNAFNKQRSHSRLQRSRHSIAIAIARIQLYSCCFSFPSFPPAILLSISPIPPLSFRLAKRKMCNNFNYCNKCLCCSGVCTDSSCLSLSLSFCLTLCLSLFLHLSFFGFEIYCTTAHVHIGIDCRGHMNLTIVKCVRFCDFQLPDTTIRRDNDDTKI